MTAAVIRVKSRYEANFVIGDYLPVEFVGKLLNPNNQSDQNIKYCVQKYKMKFRIFESFTKFHQEV